MKTNGELKQIAIDIQAGKIFSDRHCRNEREVLQTFMPLVLIAPPEHNEKEDEEDYLLKKTKYNILIKQLQKAVFFYEHMDKAMPMSVNGMPTFPSFRYLERDEFDKMNEYYVKVVELLRNI